MKNKDLPYEPVSDRRHTLQKQARYTTPMAITPMMVELVWRKATIVPGYDPTVLRKDTCGAWIARAQYGNRNSQHGWEIDHIDPSSLGGGDSYSNLRPLQWQNNCNRSNGRLTCPVMAA